MPVSIPNLQNELTAIGRGRAKMNPAPQWHFVRFLPAAGF